MLWVVVSNQPQNETEKSHDTSSSVRPVGAIIPSAPIAAQDQNTSVTNSNTTLSPTNIAPGDSDPFKTFLKTHKYAQPQVNTEPVPQNQPPTRDIFKEALEKYNKETSSANPFIVIDP